MPKQLLHSIEQLRDELQQSHSLDVEQRTELLNVLRALEHVLAEEDDVTADQHQPLIDQLKESVWQIEASHPTLTVIVGRILDNLARMGI